MMVGPDNPPTSDMDKWERGKSPWHKDAFPDHLSSAAPEQGERKDGWFCLDAFGNQIGWVPDGTVIKE